MGKSGSKPDASASGVNDLVIIQNQEVHTEHHITQDFMLSCIIVLLTLLIVEKLLREIFAIMQKRGHKSVVIKAWSKMSVR